MKVGALMHIGKITDKEQLEAIKCEMKARIVFEAKMALEKLLEQDAIEYRLCCDSKDIIGVVEIDIHIEKPKVKSELSVEVNRANGEYELIIEEK